MALVMFYIKIILEILKKKYVPNSLIFYGRVWHLKNWSKSK